MTTVVHFGRARKEWRRLRAQSRRVSAAMVDRVRLASVLESLPDVSFPIAAAVMIQLTVLGRLSWDELVVALALLAMTISSLREVMRAWEYRIAFQEANRRILQLLSYPRIREPRRPLELAGKAPVSIEFLEVQDGEKILQPVTASASAGDRILLTGPSGSGKSVLVALAARLSDPRRGRILVGGKPLDRLSHASLHRAVQLVSPRVPLTRGTVEQNVVYGATAPDPDLVARVVRLCLIDAPDRSLPSGLNTRVQEKGQNLPQGLRARLALARAVVAKPRLLLIDDPTFATDPDAGIALRRVLAEVSTTVLMVAARDECLAANRIWELDHGRLTTTTPGAKSARSVEAGRLSLMK